MKAASAARSIWLQREVKKGQLMVPRQLHVYGRGNREWGMGGGGGGVKEKGGRGRKREGESRREHLAT